MTIHRRQVLRSGLALGCSLAATPLVTPVTFAATPGDARLVVIVLRGGMDGLDAIRPLSDPGLKTLRPDLAQEGLALDGMFALHPALAPLLPLWQSGEFAVAHAVSTPYRDRRSHFDGQDVLENGGNDAEGQLTPAGDGWLNRAVAQMQGARAETAFAVGYTTLMLLRGQQEISTWAPDAALDLTPQADLLLERIYAQDPLFAQAHAEAEALAALEGDGPISANKARRAEALARFTAQRLQEETRIAAFSLGGWDTHARQDRTLPRALSELVTAITVLRDTLGPDWSRTVVMAVTEFGRTARLNGSGGTDHGTGGAALFAGGALAGGRVLSDWPGLRESALFQDRDLMPTRDLRAMAAWVLRDHMNLPRSALETLVFPGLDMGAAPRLIA